MAVGAGTHALCSATAAGPEVDVPRARVVLVSMLLAPDDDDAAGRVVRAVARRGHPTSGTVGSSAMLGLPCPLAVVASRRRPARSRRGSALVHGGFLRQVSWGAAPRP